MRSNPSMTTPTPMRGDEHARINVNVDDDERGARASATSRALTPRRAVAIGLFALGVFGVCATTAFGGGAARTMWGSGDTTAMRANDGGTASRAPWRTTTTTTTTTRVDEADEDFTDDFDFAVASTTGSDWAREKADASSTRKFVSKDSGVRDGVGARGRWINSIEREVALGVTPTARAKGEWIPTKVVDVNATTTTEEDVYGDDAPWIENYAEMKRRLAREAALEAAGAETGAAATAAGGFAKLGATRDDCPEAYMDALNVDNIELSQLGGQIPLGFSKYSVHATKIAALAQHIYILCTGCTTGIPEEWRHKASFVHGFKIDECLKTKGVNHWLKASFSHAHALMDAKKRGYGVVAIVEEDSITRDGAFREGLTPSETLWHNMGQIRKVMNEVPKWQTIRVGYRPMFVDRPWESTSKVVDGEKCPRVCACDKVSDFACVMRQAGCDMRSSDFYLVKSSAMDAIIEAIYNGKTVDCEALSRVPNQVFITPQLSYQTHLDLPLEKQIKYSQDFADACAVGGELMSH